METVIEQFGQEIFRVHERVSQYVLQLTLVLMCCCCRLLQAQRQCFYLQRSRAHHFSALFLPREGKQQFFFSFKCFLDSQTREQRWCSGRSTLLPPVWRWFDYWT